MSRLLFVLFSLISCSVIGQPLPLNFKSTAIRLCVAGDESLVLTTRAGEVGLTPSLNERWRKIDPVKNNIIGPTLDQPNFFNKDTGFVSGFIAGKNGSYNIIYHTTNGGKTWNPVHFGQSGWVDDAIHLMTGEAWMSVSGSGIAYTKDFGLSWKKINIPEIRQRFAAIFFNGKKEGIIGSLWNMLAYTPDNGASWKMLPTPLDQKTYTKTDNENRPEINRVALIGDFLIVKQEDLVFYSQKNTVDWKWMKDYNDFYTDPENTALFLKAKDGNIVRCDTHLKVLYTYPQSIQAYDASVRNGSLFLVTGKGIVRALSDNTLQNSVYHIDASSDIEPDLIGYAGKGAVGIRDHQLFIQADGNSGWQPLFRLPFSLDSGELSVIPYNMIQFSRNDDSLFYLDLSGRVVMKKSKSRMIEDFMRSGIQQVRFEAGSQGCFHSFSNELIYSKRGAVYAGVIENQKGRNSRSLLNDNPDELAQRDIDDFVGKLPKLFNEPNNLSFKELGFTEEELERCRKDIQDFKASLGKKKTRTTRFHFSKNNLDFDRLLKLVDSVQYISPEKLYRVVTGPSEFWSTTSFWKKIVLLASDNGKLVLQHQYYTDNAFGFPWKVTLNDYTTYTTNIEVYRFVNTIYPAFLPSERRINLLHELVKALY
jgi:hypothetical protein